MTLRQIAERLSRSIATAANEHGRPNGFDFSELEAFYNGPRPMLAGRAARRHPEILEGVGAIVNGSRIEVQ